MKEILIELKMWIENFQIDLFIFRFWVISIIWILFVLNKEKKEKKSKIKKAKIKKAKTNSEYQGKMYNFIVKNTPKREIKEEEKIYIA